MYYGLAVSGKDVEGREKRAFLAGKPRIIRVTPIR